MTSFAASAVVDFVDWEASLLDARRFGEWLDLFSDDAVYWVPVTPDQVDPRDGPSLVYETKDALTARVLRVEDPQTLPQQPYSRCSRILGRVRLEQPSDGDDAAIVAQAPFHLVEAVAKHDAEDSVRVFAGTASWGLVETGSALRIRWKRVDLVNSERGLFGATILL